MSVRIDVGGTAEDEVVDADVIEVEDGHLKVKNRRSQPAFQTVAIYRPGTWRSAAVISDARPAWHSAAAVIDQAQSGSTASLLPAQSRQPQP